MTLFLTIVAAIIVSNLLLAFLVAYAREIGIVLLVLFGASALILLYAFFGIQVIGWTILAAVGFIGFVALSVVGAPKPPKPTAPKFRPPPRAITRLYNTTAIEGPIDWAPPSRTAAPAAPGSR